MINLWALVARTGLVLVFIELFYASRNAHRGTLYWPTMIGHSLWLFIGFFAIAYAVTQGRNLPPAE